MQIPGNTFLVSGGGSGLGAACARLLAGQGGDGVIADVNRDAGEKLAAELSPRAQFVLTDVTNEASVQDAIGKAKQAFGHINGSIQCAGIALAEKVVGKSGPHALTSFVK